VGADQLEVPTAAFATPAREQNAAKTSNFDKTEQVTQIP
jgi:hypothetical protein